MCLVWFRNAHIYVLCKYLYHTKGLLGVLKLISITLVLPLKLKQVYLLRLVIHKCIEGLYDNNLIRNPMNGLVTVLYFHLSVIASKACFIQ